MKCAIDWCQRARVRDALYCSVHLTDAWANREPVAHVPEWIRRKDEGKLPPKEMAA